MLALSGGSTPERAYTELAQPTNQARLDWSRTHLFFGDERFVPPDDPRSNFHLAKRTLLGHVPLPPGQLWPIPTDVPGPAVSATTYASTLAVAFGVHPEGPPPSFDCILL